MRNQEILIKDVDIIENHRLKVDDESIADLMCSIKQNGLKQPIGVAINKKKRYNLIFGNRRLLACQKLGWTKINAIVEDGMDLKQLIVLNVTENLQRKDPSFVEFGRMIEKLESMGLTTKEISIRIGIDEKKVVSIKNTYTKFPAKHRAKVAFLGKGKKQKGAIPAQVATGIVRLKKDFGISDKNVDKLIEFVGKGDLVRENLKNLAVILKTGLKFEDALEMLFDYEVYRIDLIANRLEVSKMILETNALTAQRLFKKILYGQLKGLNKPDFINL